MYPAVILSIKDLMRTTGTAQALAPATSHSYDPRWLPTLISEPAKNPGVSECVSSVGE